MSGVHLFCIKVSGKDATGVGRLACSSLNATIKRMLGGQRNGWWLHILLRRWLQLHSWLAQHTGSQFKQTTPINPALLDASLFGHRLCVRSQWFAAQPGRLRRSCVTWKQTEAKPHSQRLLENNRLVTLLSSNYAKTGSLVPTFQMEGEKWMHIITALTSLAELPFPHGMLIRLFPAIYKNESQVFEENCRQGHWK